MLVKFKNWLIITVNDLRGCYLTLQGKAYGHSRFPEGADITTSLVNRLIYDTNNKLLVAHTMNTRYQLALSDMEPDNQNSNIEDLNTNIGLDTESMLIYSIYTEVIDFLNCSLIMKENEFIERAIKEYHIDKNLFIFWVRKYSIYREELKMKYEHILDFENVDLILCLSDKSSYYFECNVSKHQGRLEVNKDKRVHLSMTQDSILLDIDQYHFKYFPFGYNKLAFYSIDNGNINIEFSVLNTGSEKLLIGTPWGSYKVKEQEHIIISSKDTCASTEPVVGTDLYPPLILGSD